MQDPADDSAVVGNVLCAGGEFGCCLLRGLVDLPRQRALAVGDTFGAVGATCNAREQHLVRGGVRVRVRVRVGVRVRVRVSNAREQHLVRGGVRVRVRVRVRARVRVRVRHRL